MSVTRSRAAGAIVPIACLATACAVSPVADAQPRGDYGLGPGLIAYDTPGGYGEVLYFGGRAPTYAPDLEFIGWEGRIAAIEVRHGRWIACEYPHFGGFCLYLDSNVPNVATYGFRGRVSSIAEDNRHAPPDLIVYEERGFSGGARKIDAPGADLERLGIAGRVDSVRILKGVWRFCTRRDGYGGCVDLDGDVADLGAYGLRGRVHSVERVDGRGGFDGGWGDGRPGAPYGRGGRRERGDPPVKLILFEDRAFSGRSAPLRGDVLDLSAYAFSDRTSSIRVLEGRWEICDRPNFGGRCALIDGDLDDRDLIRLGLQDRISSVRGLASRAGREDHGQGRGGDGDRAGRGSPRPQVILYRDQGYRGGSIAVTGDVANLQSFGFDNRMTSIRVLEGVWELCEHPNYGGACTTIKADEDYSGRPFNDHLSSLRRVDG